METIELTMLEAEFIFGALRGKDDFLRGQAYHVLGAKLEIVKAARVEKKAEGK